MLRSSLILGHRLISGQPSRVDSRTELSYPDRRTWLVARSRINPTGNDGEPTRLSQGPHGSPLRMAPLPSAFHLSICRDVIRSFRKNNAGNEAIACGTLGASSLVTRVTLLIGSLLGRPTCHSAPSACLSESHDRFSSPRPFAVTSHPLQRSPGGLMGPHQYCLHPENPAPPATGTPSHLSTETVCLWPACTLIYLESRMAARKYATWQRLLAGNDLANRLLITRESDVMCRH
jgi:hypothetical protein